MKICLAIRDPFITCRSAAPVIPSCVQLQMSPYATQLLVNRFPPHGATHRLGGQFCLWLSSPSRDLAVRVNKPSLGRASGIDRYL